MRFWEQRTNFNVFSNRAPTPNQQEGKNEKYTIFDDDQISMIVNVHCTSHWKTTEPRDKRRAKEFSGLSDRQSRVSLAKTHLISHICVMGEVMFNFSDFWQSHGPSANHQWLTGRYQGKYLLPMASY
jgi:hypothetical protein